MGPRVKFCDFGNAAQVLKSRVSRVMVSTDLIQNGVMSFWLVVSCGVVRGENPFKVRLV